MAYLYIALKSSVNVGRKRGSGTRPAPPSILSQKARDPVIKSEASHGDLVSVGSSLDEHVADDLPADDLPPSPLPEAVERELGRFVAFQPSSLNIDKSPSIDPAHPKDDNTIVPLTSSPPRESISRMTGFTPFRIHGPSRRNPVNSRPNPLETLSQPNLTNSSSSNLSQPSNNMHSPSPQGQSSQGMASSAPSPDGYPSSVNLPDYSPSASGQISINIPTPDATSMASSSSMHPGPPSQGSVYRSHLGVPQSSVDFHSAFQMKFSRPLGYPTAASFGASGNNDTARLPSYPYWNPADLAQASANQAASSLNSGVAINPAAGLAQPAAITPANLSAEAEEHPGYGGFRFPDGDILIGCRTGFTWQAYCSDLSKASPVLAGIIGSTKPLVVTGKNPDVVKTVKYNLEMVAHPEDDQLRTFKVVDFSKARIQLANFEGQAGIDRHNRDKIYDMFFRIITHQSPKFNTVVAFTLIKEVNDVLLVAENLKAVSAVKDVLEAHLLRLGSQLWVYVSEDPDEWASLGGRMESPLIFREAMIHVVGKIDAKIHIDRDHYARDDLHKRILLLAEEKVRELKARKVACEGDLVAFTPARLMHREENGVVPDRSVYANDIYFWQAHSLIRQYIASAFHKNLHHRAKDGGYKLYRTLYKGGNAYLDITNLPQFFEVFAMSSKGKRILGDAVLSVKHDLKPLLDDLMKDRRQNGHGEELGYLTCTEITDEELPWAGI
ncbi:uncharacterized protein BP5553_01504 [Venustampulla echinocandica]|uniref:Uncharacterized protein n=1 Tax=Venustampulla echinocandica TaxID=2656787 RepID=A0A370U189_9HELO|nr:uncharacterized protein BP5553_01504 [Venustampulla echinocandica]RDL41525.1 hypothetical protein BP5553_01504 [Venustampulla echinocandica]